MSRNPNVYGDVDGQQFKLDRFDKTHSRHHGLIFTDDSPNGQFAYRDLCHNIEHEATANGVDVYIIDPRRNLNSFSKPHNVDTHEVSFETLGNPMKFAFPEGFTNPVEFGIQKNLSLLVSLFELHGFELSIKQKDLLFELVRQAYDDINASRRALDGLFGPTLTLADLTTAIVTLCKESSQPILKDFAAYIEALQTGDKYEELGGVTGRLNIGQNPIQRYTFDTHPFEYGYKPQLIYQSLLNCIMREAHTSVSKTWVVMSGYDWLLEEGVSQRTIEEALSVASGGNTAYEFVIENLSDNSVLPPIQNWYNQGCYTRFYTTDAPPSLGMTPAQYAEWFNIDSNSEHSRSVLAMSKHNKGPYQLETEPSSPNS